MILSDNNFNRFISIWNKIRCFEEYNSIQPQQKLREFADKKKYKMGCNNSSHSLKESEIGNILQQLIDKDDQALSSQLSLIKKQFSKLTTTS